jgi:hypothetical protein
VLAHLAQGAIQAMGKTRHDRGRASRLKLMTRAGVASHETVLKQKRNRFLLAQNRDETESS